MFVGDGALSNATFQLKANQKTTTSTIVTARDIPREVPNEAHNAGVMS